MRDPYVLLAGKFGVCLWHRDKDGVDGACGWFMRANHGSHEVLESIERRFALDWTHQVQTRNMGETNTALFDNTQFSWPTMSIHGIALNLFFMASFEHFKHDRKKTIKFMQSNLFEILLFAENPIDSAHHGWLHQFGFDEKKSREERIHSSAVMIYGWILRATRPWYKHPRWHIHHWRVSVQWRRWFQEKPKEGIRAA
jgi:hypothetical protein